MDSVLYLFHKCKKFLEQVNKYWLLEKDCHVGYIGVIFYYKLQAKCGVNCFKILFYVWCVPDQVPSFVRFLD